jgi:ribosomal protein L7/L12
MEYMNDLDFEGEVRNRLSRLEHKVDFLLAELGLAAKEQASLPRINPALAEVVALLKQNKKINAIALYRKITGASLEEAKVAVENLVY